MLNDHKVFPKVGDNCAIFGKISGIGTHVLLISVTLKGTWDALCVLSLLKADMLIIYLLWWTSDVLVSLPNIIQSLYIDRSFVDRMQ